MEKINLLLHPDNYTSFHQVAFQRVIGDYFNFVYLDEHTSVDAKNTIVVTNFTEDKWWTDYHQQGYKILMDNLWGIGPYELDNSFLLLNKNWFWYHESLIYKANGYHSYQPNKTYGKLALMPMGLIKRSHNLLFDSVGDFLDDMHWSYVERFQKFLPEDPHQNHVTGQRYINPMWYNDTHLSLVSETILESCFDLHVTEKTYKPLAYYHPFLVFGQPGILNHLHEQGFETFENLFDESYDSEDNIDQRLAKIIENLKNYNKVPYDKITQDKLQHNHNLFFDTDLIHKRIIAEIAEPIVNWFESKR
jgi:hypothetical protein